jgi:phage gpG-like protein
MTTPKSIFDSILKRIQTQTRKAVNKSTLFVAKQFDLAYENEGFKQANRRGFGFKSWIPTTRAAERNRKKYPRASATQKTGVKGFTQAQARYLFGANTLEDTGKMRASLGIEIQDIPNNLKAFVGVGVKYITTHEKGGTVTINGNSFTVPARPNQHLTEQEVKEVENTFIKEYKNA